jgi:hypothetical protein
MNGAEHSQIYYQSGQHAKQGIAGNKLIVLDSNIVLDNVVDSTGVDMQAYEVAMHEA